MFKKLLVLYKNIKFLVILKNYIKKIIKSIKFIKSYKIFEKFLNINKLKCIFKSL